MSKHKLFSEQEAGEILQRAVRLQEESKSGDYTPGVTEEELRKIAKEAGIDQSCIDRAIAGLDTEEKSTVGLFNMTEEFERVVDGEMDPEDFDTISNMVKRNGRVGLMQVGRTLSGQGMTGVHMVYVNVESRKGRTKLKVKYLPLSAYFIGMHMPIILSFILFANFLESGRVGTGLLAAGGLLGLGWLVFRSLVKSGRRAARALTKRITERIEEEVDPLRENLSQAQPASQEEQSRQTT